MTPIGEINELIGPLFGPYMRQLLILMREKHGYREQPLPSTFARSVLVVIGGEHQELLEECPEIFAAKALQALGQELDMTDAETESAAFQKRLQFHRGRG